MVGEPRVEQPGGLIDYLERGQLIRWGEYAGLEELGGYVPGNSNGSHGSSYSHIRKPRDVTAAQQMSQLNSIMGGWKK